MDLLELASQSDEGAANSLEAYVAFADWAADEIAGLRGLGRSERYEAGAVVVAADADDRDLFVVVEGALEIFRFTGGAHTRVAELGPNDLFGEIAFVDGGPRSGTVRARSETRVVRISPHDLDDLATRDPVLALRFLGEVARILANRLRLAYSA